MMSSATKRINRRQFLLSCSGAGIAVSVPAISRSLSPARASTGASSLPADITELSATDLSLAIRQRQISCVEVMKAYLQRIHLYNPVYNAIVGMPESDSLLNQAAIADEALSKGDYWGWMHGMPHAVKDLANAKGLVNSRGSLIFERNVSKQDAIFVNRIRRQGAIFLGKTNVPEFGLGSQSYNKVYGTTRNAYNPDLIAGGSSGGAACAMATHMVPIADGSDMMGSLRNPACYNNVIGFRPTQGRVPHQDKDLFFQQLAYNGPMGRTVLDTIRLLETMSGYDARVPLSLRGKSKIKVPSEHNLDQFKIGWMGDYNGYLSTEPGVMDVCEKALKKLSQEGCIVEDCAPDYDMGRLWQAWLTLRHWTICGGAKIFYDNQDTRKLLKPELVWEIEGGLNLTGLDLSAAVRARSDWYKALLNLFERYDFLVLPTAQVFPFSADIHWPKAINGRKMDTYHRWMEVAISGTLSGCPVINLPAGFDRQGRPMGLQFIGPLGEDRKVLEFALAYEASVDHLQRRPQMQTRI